MSIKRQVFYSFHYENDAWRASQIRNIGVIEGNEPVSDNEWEKVTQGGSTSIKSWIDKQMKGRSCTVVLIGSETADRKWINYEIRESWNRNMGVVGIYIHGLKDYNKVTSDKRENPFNYIKLGDGKALSSVVKCYNPSGNDSKSRYNWIVDHISEIIEEAIRVRKSI